MSNILYPPSSTTAADFIYVGGVMFTSISTLICYQFDFAPQKVSAGYRKTISSTAIAVAAITATKTFVVRAWRVDLQGASAATNAVGFFYADASLGQGQNLGGTNPVGIFSGTAVNNASADRPKQSQYSVAGQSYSEGAAIGIVPAGKFPHGGDTTGAATMAGTAYLWGYEV